jgi:hypothetical protein
MLAAISTMWRRELTHNINAKNHRVVCEYWTLPRKNLIRTQGVTSKLDIKFQNQVGENAWLGIGAPISQHDVANCMDANVGISDFLDDLIDSGVFSWK